jgi:hypothetical protein
MLKDILTDADTLYIEFPECAPHNHKLLIVAAAILIDYIFFES